MGISTREFIGFKKVDLSSTDTVAPLGTDTQKLTPPAGQCYQLNDLDIEIPDPAGSGAGTHFLYLEHDGKNQSIGYVYGAFGNDLKWQLTGWDGPTERPSSHADQMRMLYDGLWASNDTPLNFRYYNNTDVNQTQNRIIYVYVKVFNNGF